MIQICISCFGNLTSLGCAGSENRRAATRNMSGAGLPTLTSGSVVPITLWWNSEKSSWCLDILISAISWLELVANANGTFLAWRWRISRSAPKKHKGCYIDCLCPWPSTTQKIDSKRDIKNKIWSDCVGRDRYISVEGVARSRKTFGNLANKKKKIAKNARKSYSNNLYEYTLGTRDQPLSSGTLASRFLPNSLKCNLNSSTVIGKCNSLTAIFAVICSVVPRIRIRTSYGYGLLWAFAMSRTMLS